MADLKENELAQKNDFNFVRALDAAGNSILINKSDLVKVLEELLKEPMASRGEIHSAEELDATKKNGLYYIINPIVINGEAFQYLMVEIQNYKYAGWAVQRIRKGSQIYARTFANKTWGTWYLELSPNIH